MSAFPSPGEARILALLKTEAYGLELVRRAGGSLTRNAIYTQLSRLEEKGLIESRWEASPERRPLVRVYRLTERGKRALRACSVLGD